MKSRFNSCLIFQNSVVTTLITCCACNTETLHFIHHVYFSYFFKRLLLIGLRHENRIRSPK
jgi:hypothetical protein